jgi:hypothetical protein
MEEWSRMQRAANRPETGAAAEAMALERAGRGVIMVDNPRYLTYSCGPIERHDRRAADAFQCHVPACNLGCRQ